MALLGRKNTAAQKSSSEVGSAKSDLLWNFYLKKEFIRWEGI